MFSSFFITWLRNVTKKKLHYTLCVGGMVIGLTSLILTSSFVFRELSFDTRNSNQLYRIVFGETDDQGSALTSHVMGDVLSLTYPDVEVTHFNNAGNANVNFKVDDKQFFESSFFFVDKNVFSSFSFPLQSGDQATALSEPFSIVVTPETALKYFGETDVVGKTIRMEWGMTWYDLKITGVLERAPEQSHLAFHYLISIATAEKIFQPQSFFTDWTANFCYNYVLVPATADIKVIERGLNELYLKNSDKKINTDEKLRLQPLNRIHLYSKLSGEIGKNTDVKYVYMALCAGMLLLVICFINYINILSSLYSTRLKEIGVRKVLGASFDQLVYQFVGESVFCMTIALIISISLAVGLTTPFYSLLGIAADRSILFSRNLLLCTILFGLGVGLIGGIYPSYLVIRFNPGDVLYGKVKQLIKGYQSKKILAGVQIAIAFVLIAGTIGLRKQLAFIQEKPLGFDKDELIYIPQGRAIREQAEFIKTELMRTAIATRVSLSSHIPSSNLNFKVPVIPEGGNPDGTDRPWPVSVVSVDFDFADTYALSLTSGRFFSRDFASDSTQAFVINERTAEVLGWKEPLGKTLEMTFNVGDGTIETRKGQVIGVVKNFHFESLHKSIEPMIFMCKPFWYYYVSIRLPRGANASQIESLKNTWSKLRPELPFEYVYMDTRIQKLYTSENSWSKGVSIIALIAMVISCLGIFALITFLIQSKLKEFSIRKVLGATPSSIVSMMIWDVSKIVLLASVVAIPITIYLIGVWMNGFAYRTSIGLPVYAGSLILISFIVLCIILSQVLKASKANPVTYLKND